MTTVLNEVTAVCEGCGCTWDNACRGGCAWNREAWREGRALCTACTSIASAPTSGASVVSVLTNEQVLDLMRQDLRTTVPAFRAKLERAIDLSIDEAIRQRIANAYADDALRAVMLRKLVSEAGHG